MRKEEKEGNERGKKYIFKTYRPKKKYGISKYKRRLTLNVNLVILGVFVSIALDID